MKREPIQLTDTLTDVAVKMSDGNPGAISVIVQMFKSNNIDPYDILGGLRYALLLEKFGIFGTDIYILNNDICDRNMAKTLAVLKATEIGLFDSAILKNACHRQDRSGKELVPVEELYLKIKKQFPSFDEE
jgi:hypothetical protein